MTKKEVALYIFGGILICYVLGYSLGVTKVILFQSTGDGRNAIVNVCDVDGEYIDENGGCHNYGAAFGFLAGFSVASSVENKRLSHIKKHK